MAILAYVGIPGSGKSYEVVSSVILEHFKKGRRIVSNIEGVTHQKLVNFCIAKGEKEEQLGEFISVTDETCQQPDFFPYKGAETSICKAGDLICLDEVWRIFPNEKVHQNHRSFIAEHRHFTNPDTGECCDLVVINQSVSQLPRFIKDRIETTYQMSKLTALGMRNRYRVDVFVGAKTTKTNRTLQLQRKYDKAIFALYKSYDGENGKENVVDGRSNILRSPQFIGMMIAIVVLSFGGYKAYSSFFKSSLNETEKISNTSQGERISNDKSLDIKLPIYIPPKLSEKWKISGELQMNGKSFVILIDKSGQLRFEPRSAFSFSGRMLEGKIDGEIVNYYSGANQ